MSLVKKQDKPVEEDRAIDSRQSEEDEITIPPRRRGRTAEPETVSPSILGWKVQCPHCGEPFIVKYTHDGSYELTVDSAS